MNRRFITVRETADYLCLHPVTIRRLIDRGEIPATKIGRSVRIDKISLIKKMEEKEI